MKLIDWVQKLIQRLIQLHISTWKNDIFNFMFSWTQLFKFEHLFKCSTLMKKLTISFCQSRRNCKYVRTIVWACWSQTWLFRVKINFFCVMKDFSKFFSISIIEKNNCISSFVEKTMNILLLTRNCDVNLFSSHFFDDNVFQLSLFVISNLKRTR